MLEVVNRKTDELIPYARNARTHSAEQVAQIAGSIKEFGFNNPVLIDQSGGIIAGHGRVLAAQRLGLKEVPTITLGHLSDTQRRAYILADNKLALNAGWDEKMLGIEFADLQSMNFDVSITGFDTDDIDAMLAELNATPEGLTDSDEVPDVQEASVTKPGDVWILGNHRLMCGDSTKADQVARLMDGALADLLVTDPPYNVAYEGKTADALTIENDSMGNEEFRAFLLACFQAADSSMRPGAVFYVWYAPSEGFNFQSAAFDAGWKIRQCLVWNKNSMVMGRQDYQWKHEPCLYGWKDGAAHSWHSDRKQVTVLEFNKPTRNGEHPTMKPVDLIEYQVKNSSRAGENVLDLFGGSGTTMIACEKTGRINFSMEIDPKYCDVIVNRWEMFTGRKAELVK